MADEAPSYLPLEPGLHLEVSEEDYHGKFITAMPALSSSIGKILIDETAAKAWSCHPALNPNFEREEKQGFDLGSAAHDVLLGKGDNVVEVTGFADWRKDAAKAQRDAVYAAGKIPVLTEQMNEIQAMARAVRAQLDRHEDAQAFTNGFPEVTGIWIEGEGDDQIVCKMRLDWLHKTILEGRGNVFYDFKSVTAGAGPLDWGKRNAFNLGADFQAAFYSRGLCRLFPWLQYPHFRFVVAETKAPYCVAVHEFADEAMVQADEKVEAAIRYWRWCMRTGAWPGYSREVYTLYRPTWDLYEWEARKADRQMRGLTSAPEDDAPMFELGNSFMAPTGVPKVTGPAFDPESGEVK